MLRPWMKLLPWCIVAWIARRNCETFEVCGATMVQPFPGALISK